jgi:hypothetical protein
LALGWKYGRAYYFAAGPGFIKLDADQAAIYKLTSLIGLDYESADYDLARTSYAILPAAFTWVDSTNRDAVEWMVPEEGSELAKDYYLWSAPDTPKNRYAMIHAFDAEIELAIVGYVDLGYSPGELVDFLLGIFTIDIAADDGR